MLLMFEIAVCASLLVLGVCLWADIKEKREELGQN